MERVITCIAIDDEAPALRIVEQYVARVPNLVLKSQFRNSLQAVEWLQNNSVDVLLLDIQMPQQTGIEMLKLLAKKPLVIFTTAYSDFAADAFDLDAIDYLRKPFSFQRFNKAIDKAVDHLNMVSNIERDVMATNSAEDFITIKANGALVKIYFNEIIYVQGFQEYIKIYTAKARYITYERMKNMEGILPEAQFMRVHKSYIVALKQVKAISGNMLEVAEQQIPVSRELKEQVIKRIF